MADESDSLFGEGIDDVQQVLRGAPQTADAFDIEGIAFTHIAEAVLALEISIEKSRFVSAE